jgi:PRTRC genetic system protein A
MLNAIDTALQTTTPVVMVPKFEAFQPMESNGHRFLATADGLWLEARRPWMHVIWPLVAQSAIAMPYGKVEKRMDLLKIPRNLIETFFQTADRQSPLECAAWIVWNEYTDQWKLIDMIPFEVSNMLVKYNHPVLEDGEHKVLDVHSHGSDIAYFSRDDDEDDAGGFKVVGVYGDSHGVKQAKYRLCANGLFIPLGEEIVGEQHAYA